MERKIYLCRHGETAWSLSGQHTGRTDLSLTENGIKQSIALGNRLRKTHFDAVFCSPLKRAVETCKLGGFLPTIEPDAVEWDYGKYEGKTYLEIVEENPGWDVFSKGPLGGESLEQIENRADHLIELMLNQKKGNIALFSHGHFLRILAARWLGFSGCEGAKFSLSVASLSILGFERGYRSIKLWNDTSHLG